MKNTGKEDKGERRKLRDRTGTKGRKDKRQNDNRRRKGIGAGDRAGDEEKIRETTTYVLRFLPHPSLQWGEENAHR